MKTRFQDGLGRTISRDPKILDILLKNYSTSNFTLFAQAGMEIEALQEEIAKLKEVIQQLNTPKQKAVSSKEGVQPTPKKAATSIFK